MELGLDPHVLGVMLDGSLLPVQISIRVVELGHVDG